MAIEIPLTRAKQLPIVCIDFDGVIHGYSRGWQDGTIYDPPVDGCGEALLRLVCCYRIAVFSSRSKRWLQRRRMKAFVRDLLWQACLTHTKLSETAWQATQGTPADYIPWTAYDVRDVADHIMRAFSWPFFKPPALLTIDDRAVTFNGDWSEFTPEAVRAFQPWTAKK